jgi:hypothetical protein
MQQTFKDTNMLNFRKFQKQAAIHKKAGKSAEIVKNQLNSASYGCAKIY